MNIAFITHAFPFPAEKDGHTLIAYQIIKGLAENHKISLFCFGDKNDQMNIGSISDLGVKVKIFERPKRSLFFYYLSSISKKLAWFQYRLYTKEMVNRVKELDNSPDFDIIYIHSPFVSAYLELVKNKPAVLTYIDAWSSWYQQFYDISKNPLKKLHYLQEGRKSRQLEKDLLPKAYASVVVSNVDKDIIMKHSPDANIVVIPNGVDLDYFRPSTTPPDPNQIIFSGTMDYPPNVKAVLDFKEKIWPKLKKEKPNLSWYIVGKNPTLDVFELQSLDNQITVTGYVKDIRTHLWRSAVYLSPLSLGTGFKNKIIEAMACGKAIVASPVSLAGFPVSDNKNVLIANNSQEFADKILYLLNNPDKRQKIESKARTFAEMYDWFTSVRQYENLMKQAVEHDK